VKRTFSWATLVACAATICCGSSSAIAQNNSAQPSGTSVAVIDLGEVFEKHPMLNAQLEDHKKDLQGFQAEMRQKVAQIESLASELKTLKPGTADYAAKEKQYAAMRADVQVQQVQKQRELLEHEARIRFNAYQEVQEHIKRFCQMYNIQLVTRFSREPIDPSKPQSVQMGLSRSVVFQNKLDITDYIVNLIEEAHPQAKAASNSPAIPGRRR
jgi:Skp family chaperone for outer membrane proteins